MIVSLEFPFGSLAFIIGLNYHLCCYHPWHIAYIPIINFVKMQTLEAPSIKIVSRARLEKDISLNQVKFTLEITID